VYDLCVHAGMCICVNFVILDVGILLHGWNHFKVSNNARLISFYLRDAMLAWVLAMAVCLSDRPSISVKCRCSVETSKRIELVFGIEAFLAYPTHNFQYVDHGQAEACPPKVSLFFGGGDPSPHVIHGFLAILHLP